MHSREQQELFQAHLGAISRLTTTAGQPLSTKAPLRWPRPAPIPAGPGSQGPRRPGGFQLREEDRECPRWDTCASVARPAPGRDLRSLLPRPRPAEGPGRRAEQERARSRPDPSGPAHGGLYLRREGGGSAPGARSSAPPAALPFLPPFLRPSAMPAAPARSLRQRSPLPRAAQFGAAILSVSPPRSRPDMGRSRPASRGSCRSRMELRPLPPAPAGSASAL